MKRYRHLKFLILAIALIALNACTSATLQQGKNVATFKGLKVFSPTVITLASGNCPLPSVDASNTVLPPVFVKDPADKSADCQTAAMTVNGVDLKGFVNVLLSAVMAGMAAG